MSRKRNWHAGLTRAQAAEARRIQIAHVLAFEDERARGALGAPGSIWEIGDDGRAKCRVPTAQDQVLGLKPTEIRLRQKAT